MKGTRKECRKRWKPSEVPEKPGQDNMKYGYESREVKRDVKYAMDSGV